MEESIEIVSVRPQHVIDNIMKITSHSKVVIDVYPQPFKNKYRKTVSGKMSKNLLQKAFNGLPTQYLYKVDIHVGEGGVMLDYIFPWKQDDKARSILGHYSIIGVYLFN